ncbi:MAG: hypothetical protein JWN76_2819 [Chitinophagaceae bacterium]|nr:hypothetical protein [Chitinophagaceae bacterium]
MKNFIAASFLFLICQLGRAQQNGGTIIYENRSSSSLTLNGVTKALPTNVSRYELIYSPYESVFRNIPSTDEDQKFENNGTSITTKVNNTLRIQYHDFKNHLRLNTEELGGKEFVVKDSLPELNWVMLPGEKRILGYDCKKAAGKLIRKDLVTKVYDRTVTVTPKIDTINVIAWYTTMIPFQIGPGKYNGLPGAILSVENNKGMILFDAQSISGNLKQKELKPPTKGRLISANDFDAEQKKYKEESTKALNGIQ